MKIPKQLSGITGEYYVAAEFSRRGYLAAITLRNSDGVDILVSNIKGDKTFSIQVKTTQNKRKWIWNKKVEEETSRNKYFVFVNIPKDIDKHPEYFIVNSKALSECIKEGHQNWLKKPTKNGKRRNDSNARKFDADYFKMHLSDKLIEGFDKLIHLLNERIEDADSL